MNSCACGEQLFPFDALECERLKLHKTMCRSCRADFMEFHETETDLDELLKSHRLKRIKQMAGVL